MKEGVSKISNSGLKKYEETIKNKKKACKKRFHQEILFGDEYLSL